MSTQTALGPIGARQINHNLYVGQSDLTTIQSAVTAAARMGGSYNVYVPVDYAGSESIPAITGGSVNIYIVDLRGGQRQSYLWYNNAFLAEPIFPVGVSTPQLNHYIYVGIQGRFSTIQSAVDNAVAQGGSDIVVITTSYHGSESMDALVGGETGVFIIDERTPQMQIYEWDGTNYVPSDFEPLGAIIANEITADSISAGDATFDTCEVDNSPVRTFANTADGPGEGMVWPDIGIPVSLGDHWQNPSIAPTTLARTNIANNFAGTNVFNGIWTLFIQDVFITGTTTLGTQSSPNATVVQPNGALSAPSVNVAGLLQAGLFETIGNISGPAQGSVTAPFGGLLMGWNMHYGVGDTFFINARAGGGGGFSWYNVASNAVVDNTTPWVMNLDSSGRLNVVNSIVVEPTTTQLILDSVILVRPNARLISLNTASTTIRGGFQLEGFSSDFTQGGIYQEMFQDDSGTHALFNIADFVVDGTLTCNNIYTSGLGINIAGFILRTDGGSSFIDGYPGGRLLINQQMGAGSIVAITGDLTASGLISGFTLAASNNVDVGTGGIHATGAIATDGGFFTSGAKAFRITHPLDEEKYLTHGSLEGPELGVYYRGEGVTAGGWAEITLPDYFEALAKPDDRTVSLTPLFEEAEEPVGPLAASRVKDGKFLVWSGLPTQKFYWQVTAVRGDIEPLIIEETKEALRARTTQPPDADRNGTPEDGELRTPPSHSATADAADTGRTRRADKSNRR